MTSRRNAANHEMLAMRSHSAREVRPCWRGRRPDFRVCDAAHLRQSGRATWHDTQIRQAVDPPLPPLRGLQVSRRVDQEDDGPQAVGHARGQAPIALDAQRDGVQRAAILHHEHGRDGREVLGLREAWLGETEAGRTGALHRCR